MFWHPDGDPRERFPDLVGIVPEESFLLWQMYGLCLCGCSEQTRLRHPDTPGSTEANYWCNGHVNTVRAKHGLKPGSPRTQLQKRAARKSNHDRCLDAVGTRFVLSMVREFIDQHHDGKITRFAAAVGDDHSSLSYNLRGKTRLSKKRAKMLLLAIGEKPHPGLG